MDLCFIDTETTSLSAEHGEIWEFAGIRLNPETGETSVLDFQIECDLGTADNMSLKIGRYYERFGKNGEWDSSNFEEDGILPLPGAVVSKWDAAKLISDFTRDAVLVGNVVSFDADRMDRLLRGYGQCPGWHYHLMDTEVIAYGYLLAMKIKLPVPYKGEAIYGALGIPLPSDDEVHTAFGDAKGVHRIWNLVHNSK